MKTDSKFFKLLHFIASLKQPREPHRFVFSWDNGLQIMCVFPLNFMRKLEPDDDELIALFIRFHWKHIHANVKWNPVACKSVISENMRPQNYLLFYLIKLNFHSPYFFASHSYQIFKFQSKGYFLNARLSALGFSSIILYRTSFRI